MGLVAFVANGSILPRKSGVDDRPMDRGAIPFKSPAELEVEIELPNRGLISGMGIRRELPSSWVVDTMANPPFFVL